MNEQVKVYLAKYPCEIVKMYNDLRQLIFDSVPCEPEETLWAKLPSYYVGESVVRLIPFKDHINIEAVAVNRHGEELKGYKITPKGIVIDNSLFIVESKAWGFPRNITEYYFMNNKILKAYNQVNRLEEYVRGNMSIVLKCLNLPVDYKIDTIYKIILSNFQRADNQILEDVFLCDFNMFKGFVKDIAPGIVVRNTDDSIEKWVFEEKRKTPITSDEVIEFLQGNIARDICISLLEEQVFCDSINKLYIRKTVLQRKVGLMVFQRDE